MPSAEDDHLKAFINELTADLRKGKGVVARWTKTVGSGQALAFFEDACRNLAAGNEFDAAAVCFGQLCVLDAATDAAGLSRQHTRFLDFAPLRAIAPKEYRAYAKTLTAKADPATAHTRFREVACAALDAGFVPYAAVIPDLRGLARAAGIKRAEEEAFVADRMLRSGALAGASLKVWQGALPALALLAGRDEELLELLVASEPVDGSDDPGVVQQIRDLWLDLLAQLGAGRLLSAEWFAGPGARCPMGVLFKLVRQADLPGWQSADGSVPDDAAQFSPARKFVPGDPADDNYHLPRWNGKAGGLEEFADQIRDGAADPAVRAEHAEQLGGFIAKYFRFVNIDYTVETERLWNAPEPVRDLVRELVAGWIADAASTGLHAVDAALLRLAKLAAAGYQNLDADFGAAALAVADPALALMTALRAGLPAELALPGVFGGPGKVFPDMRVAVDGDRLTVFDGWVAHVLEPRQQATSFQAPTLPRDAGVTVWHDGLSPRLAWRVDGRRYSFSLSGVDRDARISLDPDSAWPQAPAEAKVVFPGASAATRVSSGRGFVYVHAPDGAVSARVPYGGYQDMRAGDSRLVAPPAWWPHLNVADVMGSAALRAVDGAQARLLLAAGFHGPKTAASVVAEVLPDVTDKRLLAEVAEAAVIAARCETNAADLRRSLGIAQPASMPDVLRCRPDLAFHSSSPAVVGARLLDELVRAVAEEEPAPDDGGLRLVRTVEVPTGATGFWFSGNLLGGLALNVASPWGHAPTLIWERERLQAMANTPQADGSRRWRYRALTRDTIWDPDLKGQLWRTPTSVLAVLSNGRSKDASVVEYAPDGVFDPRLPDAPGWAGAAEYVRNPGWGSPDQIASLVRLLDEKGRGPVPFDAAQAVLLARKAGIDVGDAARACFGDRGEENKPIEIRRLYGSRDLSFREVEGLREQLMPDDPAELWTSGLAVERAADWWNSRGDRA